MAKRRKRHRLRSCCIHPPGRNEMIAITPPKLFSKEEVAQKQATPFPARTSSLPEIVSDQIGKVAHGRRRLFASGRSVWQFDPFVIRQDAIAEAEMEKIERHDAAPFH